MVGEGAVLLATAKGYGKRTRFAEFPVKGRGGQGVIAIQTTERNGAVIGAVAVDDDDEVMLISDRGTLVRTPASGISLIGRNTQGVRLISLGDGEALVGIEPIADLNGLAGGNGDDDSDTRGADDDAADTAASET
jgi:DNA gyrase subunit A